MQHQLHRGRLAPNTSRVAYGRGLTSRGPTVLHNTRRHPCCSLPGSAAAAAPPIADSRQADLEAVLLHGTGVAKKLLSDPGIEGDPLAFLKATEAYWKALRHQAHEPNKKGHPVVTADPAPIGGAPEAERAAAAAAAGEAFDSSECYDVIVCGGTLGLLPALALQMQGWRVAVVERRLAEGRTQEWNSSRAEMQVLVELGLITPAQLDACITSEYNPVRVGFTGGEDIWVPDCLNIGVTPRALLQIVRDRFESLGGVIHEHTEFRSATVHPDGVTVTVSPARGAPLAVGDANRPTAVEGLAGGPGRARNGAGNGVSGSGNGNGNGYANGVGGSGAAAGLNGNGRLNGNGLAHADGHANGHANGYANGYVNGHANGSASAFEKGHFVPISFAGDGSGVPKYSNGNGNGGSNGNGSGNGNGKGSSNDNGNGTVKVQAQQAAAQRSGPWKIRGRLILDCMGHYSPIVKQMRGRAKPEGMCLVVGSCAEGFPEERNTTADLLYSFTDSAVDMQLFWEAFPAECGNITGGSSSSPSPDGSADGRGAGLPRPSRRTTYMFAYTDAEPTRPDFEKLLDAYFHLLPSYQGVPLSRLEFKRVLFGGFPCHSDGPLRPGFDRVMQIGDAGAAQSPLSFGGFGSMLRHIGRLSNGVHRALCAGRLARGDLAMLQPYQPSLSCAWLFQRAMSLKVGQLRRAEGEAAAAAPVQPADAAAAAPGAAAGAAAAAAAVRVTAAGASPVPRLLAALAGAAAALLAAAAAAWRRLWWLPAGHINSLLATNFSVMKFLGPRALKPFLQDTIQLAPLTLTMWGMMIHRPLVVMGVLGQVGPKVLLGWFAHYYALLVYSLADALAGGPLRRALRRGGKEAGGYALHRWLDALQFGSSSDYKYHPPAGDQPPVPAGRDAAAAAAAGPAAAGSGAAAGDWGADAAVSSDARHWAATGGALDGSFQQQQQQQQAGPIPAMGSV